MVRLRILTLALITLALAACNRNGVSSLSKISIRAPVRMLASIPSGTTACYAVNVTGTGINANSPSSCAIKKVGMTTDFLTLNQDGTIQGTISPPKGLTIKIDLYAYFTSTSTCPKWSDAMASSSDLTNIYYLGSDTESTANDTTDSTITINYTGQSVWSLAGTACSTAAAPKGNPSGFNISAGQTRATSTNISLTGRIGQGNVMTSTHYKLVTH